LHQTIKNQFGKKVVATFGQQEILGEDFMLKTQITFSKLNE
jgi:hypothetical protein